MVDVDEQFDLSGLSNESLYLIGAELNRTAKQAKDRTDEIKRELRRRMEPGEYEFTSGKLLVSKPARQFKPDKVWEILGPEAAQVSILVPQRDLFEKEYGENYLDLVSTFEQARITFK